MDSTVESLSKDKPGSVQTKQYNNNSERDSIDIELHELEKHVSDKWMGTESDRKDMRMLGRVQVLRVSTFCAKKGGVSQSNLRADTHINLKRNFSFVSMLGFGAVLICTWELVFA